MDTRFNQSKLNSKGVKDMSCKAKLRPDIKDRGKPSVEFLVIT